MTDSDSRIISRTNPFLIVLATIGGLTILSVVVFFSFVYFTARSLVSIAPAGGKDKVGIVDVKGVITDSEKVVKTIRDFERDPGIKALVVRIDSPGGSVGASQEIYEEIKRADKQKPVVASLASIAASGGYYASLGARYIISNPGTVTGSIGVIMRIPNIQKLMEKLGIETTVIKSGRLKDMGSMTREPTPEEEAVLKGVMDDVHVQFIEAVAMARKLPEDKVRQLADGRIFSGRQAMELGLVDQLGNFSDAVEKAGRLAGIKGEPALAYPRKNRLNMMREFLEEGGAKTLAGAFRQFAESSNPQGLSY